MEMQLKSDSLKVKEKKMLFIIDGVEKVSEKSTMLKLIKKSNIANIQVIEKPTNKEISRYGRKAINGIIIIETIKKNSN